MSTWSQIAQQAMQDQVDHFSTDALVSYTVAELLPTTVTFKAAFSEGLIDGQIGSPYARLFVMPADVPGNADRNDTVIVNGTTYNVSEIIARSNRLTQISLEKR